MALRPGWRFVIVLALLLCAGRADGQNVSVTDGAVQSNDAPATYTSLTVYGTGPGGTPSTYSANATLNLTNLSIYNSGVLNANADINVSSWANLSSLGSQLNLNTGRLSADILTIGGTFVRGAGRYSARQMGVGSLSTIDYVLGDVVTEQLNVNPGGKLVLSSNLSLTGALQVDGGELLRSTARISARQLNLYATTFDLKHGDTFNTNYQSYIGNSGTVPATLNVTGSVAFGNLSVFGGSTVNANAAVTARLIDVYSNATFNVNQDVSVPGGIMQARTGGKLNLQAGTLTAYALYVSGTERSRGRPARTTRP